MISNDLLAILACPKCRNDLQVSADNAYIICGHCRLKYPVKNDIPDMIIEDAEEF